MKRILIGLCLSFAAAASGAAGESKSAAADNAIPSSGTTAARSATASKAPNASNPFTRPVVLKGTLGDQRIQANIRPKADPEEGVEGEYFAFGQSKTILLAGELDKEEFWMEESENGTDVSGQWEGRRLGDRLEGQWTSADGAVSKPFALQVIRTPNAGGRQPRTPVAKPGAPAGSQPAVKPVSQ